MSKFQIFDTLYKRDSSGGIREWRQEVEGDSWRTVSGLVDGVKVASEWHKCEAKNIGKKNATSAEEQSVAEVKAKYVKQLELGYFEKIEDIDGPIYFKPMLAKNYDDYKNKFDFKKNRHYSQPKLDGMRCLATVNGLFSRKGKKIPSAPHIHQELLAGGVWDSDDSLVFDGELYNHALKEDFDTLMSLARQTKPTAEDLEKSAKMLQYHVYDVYDGEDTKFSERMNRIYDLISRRNDESSIKIVDTLLVHNLSDIDELLGRHIEDGYEGQMIRVDGPYEKKRSSLLLKRKEFLTEEFKIVDIVEGVGNRAGMAGRITLQVSETDKRLFGAGIKGSHEYSKKLLEEASEYIDNGSEATIRYFCLTPDGIPRFPVAIYLYKGGRDS